MADSGLETRLAGFKLLLGDVDIGGTCTGRQLRIEVRLCGLKSDLCLLKVDLEIGVVEHRNRLSLLHRFSFVPEDFRQGSAVLEVEVVEFTVFDLSVCRHGAFNRAAAHRVVGVLRRTSRSAISVISCNRSSEKDDSEDDPPEFLSSVGPNLLKDTHIGNG